MPGRGPVRAVVDAGRTYAHPAGLGAAGLQVSVAPSSMTLGGMIEHLAFVEEDWITGDLLGRELPPPWDDVDRAADRDWDWHSAVEDSPEQLRGLWEGTVARMRAGIGEAIAGGGLDQLARRVPRRPEARASAGSCCT